jgi:hypothetical protein
MGAFSIRKNKMTGFVSFMNDNAIYVVTDSMLSNLAQQRVTDICKIKFLNNLQGIMSCLGKADMIEDLENQLLAVTVGDRQQAMLTTTNFIEKIFNEHNMLVKQGYKPNLMQSYGMIANLLGFDHNKNPICLEFNTFDNSCEIRSKGSILMNPVVNHSNMLTLTSSESDIIKSLVDILRIQTSNYPNIGGCWGCGKLDINGNFAIIQHGSL